MKNKKKFLALIVAAVAGFLIWWIAEPLTGEKEPWDASAAYLPIALFVTSVVIAPFFKKEFLMVPVGMLLGQFAFICWLSLKEGAGPLIVFGIGIVIVQTTLFSLFPALVVSLLKHNPEPVASGQRR